METRRLVDPPPSGRSPAVALTTHLVAARWQLNLGMAVLWLVVAGLLYLALRAVPLVDILRVLSRVGVWQVVALTAANLLILGLMTARWAILLRSLGHPVGLFSLVGLRLAGFGVSYFTPGPQFGGETVQVDLLRRRGVPLPVAISSVFLDRLVDVLANFTFLVIGLVTLVSSGVFAGISAGWAWALIPGLLILPLAHLAALWMGRQPLTWLLAGLTRRLPWPGLARAHSLTSQSETQISVLCQTQPGTLARVILLSGLIWLLVVFEFTLTLQFIGVQPTLVQVVSVLTAARVAFLMPLPGGIGALEASQVLITQALGWGAPIGVALSLIIRARDLLLASAGMWLGGIAYRKAVVAPDELPG